ncbi:MAG: twin-arginine translocase subunit TatB [Chloroflexi bacterium]|nr:twin-arginine translocase subunit TatB [Chloroflexota bacterium]
MEIFGVGPFELVLIALVAFIVLGPERIPGAMRWLGRMVRQLRQMSQQLTKDYGAEIKDITGEISAVQAELRNIKRDLTDVTRGLVTGTETIHPPKAATPAGATPVQPATDSAPSVAPTLPTPAPADDSDIIDYRAENQAS